MLEYKLKASIRISLLEKRHAGELLAFVERGRDNFQRWIPFVDKTKTLAEAEGYIEKFLTQHKDGLGYFYGLWDADRLVGMVLIKDIDAIAKVGEIGYMVDKDYEGRGIVSEACHALLSFMFGELGLQKAMLACDDRNDKCIKLAKRLGFELEGLVKRCIVIHGELCNTMYWGLFREGYQGPPS